MSFVPCGMVLSKHIHSTSLTIPNLFFISEVVNLCDQVPKEGIFENINTLEDLLKMPEWTEERPLRVVTGFGYVGTQAV